MENLVSYIIALSTSALFMQHHFVPRVIAIMLFASGVYYAVNICMKEN